MRYNGEWWTGWVGAPQWISKYQNCCWKVSAHKGTRCAGRRMHSQKFCYLSWQRLRLLCTLNMLASNLVRCATVSVGLGLNDLFFGFWLNCNLHTCNCGNIHYPQNEKWEISRISFGSISSWNGENFFDFFSFHSPPIWWVKPISLLCNGTHFMELLRPTRILCIRSLQLKLKTESCETFANMVWTMDRQSKWPVQCSRIHVIKVFVSKRPHAWPEGQRINKRSVRLRLNAVTAKGVFSHFQLNWKPSEFQKYYGSVCPGDTLYQLLCLAHSTRTRLSFHLFAGH